MATLPTLECSGFFTPEFMHMTKHKHGHGGPRPGSGRPAKTDKADWGQITCVLKKETIQALKLGAASKHFGDFLQAHLDRYPLPSREEYLAILNRVDLVIKKRRLPVIIATGVRRHRGVRRITRPRRRLSTKEFEQAILAAE